jgi:tetratricopeptide (TPR) repeat protein
MVEGRLDTRPLGAHAIRGFKSKMELFELSTDAGAPPATGATGSPASGPLIGREEILEAICAVATAVKARTRPAICIGLAGEAGLGKSRVAEAFCARLRAARFDIRTVTARSYAGHVPHSLVADVMRAFLNVPKRLEPGRDREATRAALAALPAEFREHHEAATDLLELGEPSRAWTTLTPTQRRRAIGQAMHWLVSQRLAAGPLCLVVEDLHLADRDSVRLLESILRQFENRPLVVCTSYRPDYALRWAGADWFVEFPIEPLNTVQMRRLAAALLGADPSLERVTRELVTKSDGNPFFLQQLALHLVDEGSLVGNPGAYRRRGPATTLRVPSSIASVIGARVDRLTADAKAALEAAAILGEPITDAMVAAMLKPDIGDVTRAMRGAVAAGLLVHPPSGDSTYAFSHGLMQETLSASLTRARRQHLHRRACEALVGNANGQVDELASTLLNHAYQGEAWQQAVEFSLAAMSRALAHSANREALRVFEIGLDAARRSAADQAMLARELSLRIKALAALLPLGRINEIVANLERAEIIATVIGDNRRQAAMRLQLAVIHWSQGNYVDGLDSARKAAAVAVAARSRSLEMAAAQAQMMLQHGVGRYREVIAMARGIERRFAPELAVREIIPGWAIIASVGVKVFLADALARVGDLRSAQRALDASYRELAHHEHAFSRVLADLIQAAVWIEKNRPADALTLLDGAVRLCKSHDLPTMYPPAMAALGGAMARVGRVQEAVALLEHATANQINLQGGKYNEFYLPANFGLALSLAGRHAEAITSLGRAVAATASFGQLGHQADALLLLAEAQLAAGAADMALAHFEEARAAAAACDMALVARKAELAIGRLAAARVAPRGMRLVAEG